MSHIPHKEKSKVSLGTLIIEELGSADPFAMVVFQAF
jgi:hypothetical protein